MSLSRPAPAAGTNRLTRALPFLTWMRRTNGKTVRADALAGLTGAIVVLPQGVAFATIAGMPPEYGLYTGIVPAIIAALFGSSWHLVSGPTTAASVVLFSALSGFAEPGSAHYVQLAITLALMVGLIQLALGLAKLGTIVNFISHSVVIGFTAGAGVLIILNQVRSFFGLNIPRGADPGEIILYVLTHPAEIAWPSVVVGAVTLGTGLIARRRWPKFPYMITAILVGSLFAFALAQSGAPKIATVGALPASLPPLSMPSLNPVIWVQLTPTALAVTLFALTEAISISRALAVKSEQHINSNQEFIGQGLSNVAGSFFSSYVATGSFNRSGVNYEAGAQTPLASIISALLLATLVLLVAPVLAYMPHAAMAGVLFIIGWGLIDFHHAEQIWRTSKPDAAVMAATFLATLLLDLEMAIFVGVTVSLMLYLHRTSNPSLRPRVPDPFSSGRKFTDVRSDLPECPQARVARLDGSLYFGSVNSFIETVLEYEATDPDRKFLLIVMTGVNFIDTAGAETLARVARRYRDRGGQLYLIRLKEGPRATLEQGGYLDVIGKDNIFWSKTDALRALYRRLDYDRCRACTLNVFIECARKGMQEPTDDKP
ncbi:MAG TPA: sulfate permease, partial [Beijerinckiaceae bacterium]|nr:sulfate permease [Beijerinckiaceae bacterium]